MFKIITATALTLCNISIATADVINIYAHRGYRPLAPENTLPAYTEVMRIGVDVIDMDVNMTKDKVLVVTHDLTLNPDLTKDEKGNWIIRKNSN